MIQLDLSTSQKFQVAFVAVVLVLAGYLYIHNSHSNSDATINSWVEQRNKVGVDPRQPIGPRNPVDPAKSTTVTIFACHDGHLEIAEYPDTGSPRIGFVFRPDLRRDKYDFYKSPWDRVDSIRDPYKHTLTYAAFSAAEGRPQGLLTTAALDQAQITAEKSFRQAMLDQITLIQEGARTGTYQPEMYEKVIAALNSYKAESGDPAKDTAKAALARKVIDLATKYLEHLTDDEFTAVDKYVKSVDGLLTDDQKVKVGEAVKQIANRPRAARPRAG